MPPIKIDLYKSIEGKQFIDELIAIFISDSTKTYKITTTKNQQYVLISIPPLIGKHFGISLNIGLYVNFQSPTLSPFRCNGSNFFGQQIMNWEKSMLVNALIRKYFEDADR